MTGVVARKRINDTGGLPFSASPAASSALSPASSRRRSVPGSRSGPAPRRHRSRWGCLTIGLSVVAGWAALRQRSVRAVGVATGRLRARADRAGTAVPEHGRPALVSMPAVLLLVAGMMTIDSWRATARAFADDWFRVLLTALGGFEMLMAAGAAPVAMAVGAVGGIALIGAAWLRVGRPAYLWTLVLLGTVPFAALAWTSIVPLLLMVAALAITAALPHRRETRA